MFLWKSAAAVRAERSEGKVQGLESGTQAVGLEGGCYSRVSNGLLLRQLWLLGWGGRGWERCRWSCYAENRQVLELSECLNEKSANLDSLLEGHSFERVGILLVR